MDRYDLPIVTRRQFLAATAAGLSLSPAVVADDVRKRPKRPKKPTLPENHPPFIQSTVIKDATWGELKPKPRDGKKPDRYRKLDGSPAPKMPGDVWTCT